MLSIIWYLLLPQTFFPFTIPSRESFSRQFLLSQGPSQFFFLFFSIILLSPTLSSTTAFFILSVHFTCSILLHIHISNALGRFWSFCHSVQVSAPYNATPHNSLFLSSFFKGPQKMLFFLLKASFAIAILLYFLTAVQVATEIAPQVLEAVHLFDRFIFNSQIYLLWFSTNNHGLKSYLYLSPSHNPHICHLAPSACSCTLLWDRW